MPTPRTVTETLKNNLLRVYLNKSQTALERPQANVNLYIKPLISTPQAKSLERPHLLC